MTTATKPAQDLLGGFCITVKFLGPTNYRGARYKATYRRDSEQVFTATVAYDYSGSDGVGINKAASRAAEKCLAKINKERQQILPGDPWQISAVGWDHDHYYFIASLNLQPES